MRLEPVGRPKNRRSKTALDAVCVARPSQQHSEVIPGVLPVFGSSRCVNPRHQSLPGAFDACSENRCPRRQRGHVQGVRKIRTATRRAPPECRFARSRSDFHWRSRRTQAPFWMRRREVGTSFPRNFREPRCVCRSASRLWQGKVPDRPCTGHERISFRSFPIPATS